MPAIVRGTRVCTFANISLTRVIFIFHKRRALASAEESWRGRREQRQALLKDLCILLEILKLESGYYKIH